MHPTHATRACAWCLRGDKTMPGTLGEHQAQRGRTAKSIMGLETLRHEVHQMWGGGHHPVWRGRNKAPPPGDRARQVVLSPR